ncbi:MAG: hypothetical protein KAJ35_00085, partial [Thermoplasmata archaeon]|nr:hypothetical protein [Thermoplasmata archaeon]
TIMDPGTHEITLTVSDPDYSKTTELTVIIEPRGGTEPLPNPNDGDDGPGTNWLLIVGILVAIIIVGVVLFIATSEKRTERQEEKMDAIQDTEEERKAMEQARGAPRVITTESSAAAADAGGEVEGEDYEDIGASDRALAMEATVTEEASADVKKLFSGVGDAGPERTEEEKESMRLENQKRQYQNAIGRLPYGIPSKELADMDWVALASVLVTGEKKMVEGGKDVTQIEGRWYYSDHEDTGTFLKEHGKKEEPKKVAPKAAPSMTDVEMLRKLEERFVLGEISEETYNRLREKYEGDE